LKYLESMSKKVYIAGKIGDLPPSVFLTLFEEAEKEVKNMGYEPVSPTTLPHEHDKSWQSYMKEDLTAMMQCDAVYALKNWRHSPGARIEVELAMSLSINIIFQI